MDKKASAIRVNMVRLVLAIAVAFKIHTRIGSEGFNFGEVDGDVKWYIDWDRCRLRGLLTRADIAVYLG